jgi:geranylgeranyl diphosphate synthase, type II
MMQSKIEAIERALHELNIPSTPAGLYEPMQYILQLGGKRMRPVLVLMGHELFDGKSNVIPQALAIELFHNFSLIHDDIIDRAPIRRGKPTVHTKWNENTAILSGDGMLVMAYQQLAKCEEKYLLPVLELFSQTAIEVCEGQQLDMEFENRNDVSIDEYLRMISLKTAVLLGAALSTGAMLAGAKKDEWKHLYEFGKNLGISFQLQDDLLDTFGNEEKFGKKSGGDITANKKTFLYLSAKKLANEKQQAQLDNYFNQSINESEKISVVKDLFLELNIEYHTRNEMDRFYNLAMQHLSAIAVDEKKKKPLHDLAASLMVREY